MRGTTTALSLLIPLTSALLAASRPAHALEYTIRPTELRGEGGVPGKRMDVVDANQTVAVMERRGEWTYVRAGVERKGWVPTAVVSDTWIKVWKKERRLLLMKGDVVARELTIALGSQDPVGDKRQRGDGATPEGRFYIAEPDPSPEAGRYGARSMRLSYPAADDARRGLAAGIINRAEYLAIIKAVRAGEVPPQKTGLGGSIRIHGGGSGRDWTLGCIALEDKDAIFIYERTGKGTRVDVYASKADDARLSAPGFLSQAILAGGLQQVAAQARYTVAAMKTAAKGFPGGDIDPGQAVCTDVIVRAVRAAGLDLQPLVYEDRVLHGGLYPDRTKSPSTQLDHRRVRVLVPYLQRHAAAGAFDTAAGIKPGDIVIFDTGIANGTRFDHIGIVDGATDGHGQSRAINIWTVGYQTSSMALIGRDYPTVTAWFRLGHPYDFQ